MYASISVLGGVVLQLTKGESDGSKARRMLIVFLVISLA